ncbi:MAG: hypothetical protein WCB27_19465 [Thermoguttaceae bacterium]
MLLDRRPEEQLGHGRVLADGVLGNFLLNEVPPPIFSGAGVDVPQPFILPKERRQRSQRATVLGLGQRLHVHPAVDVRLDERFERGSVAHGDKFNRCQPVV